MMKFLLTVLMALGSFNAFAKKNEPQLLTSEQLRALTPDQQAKYLRSVQKIMAVMTSQSLYMADGKPANDSRMPAAAIIQAEENKKTKSAKAPAVASSISTGDLEARRAELNNFSNVSSTETNPGIVIGEAKPLGTSTPAPALKKTSESTPESEIITETKEEAFPPAVSSAVKSTSAEVTTTIAPKKPAAIAATAPASAVATAPVEKQKTEEKVKSEESPTAKEAEVKPVENKNYFRCMYSGWVVKKSPCAPVRKFPEDFAIDGVDKEKMKCDPKSTMCNPILFGLRLPEGCTSFSEGDCRKNSMPICVRTGAWPTKDCYNETTLKDARVAVEIGKVNPKQYDEYTIQFADLCQPSKIKTNPFAENRKISAQSVRNDIKITCDWATRRLLLAKEEALKNISIESETNFNNKKKQYKREMEESSDKLLKGQK